MIDWDKQPLGELPDTEIARRLGVSTNTVGRERQKRSIPRYRPVIWDEQPFGEIPDAEIARQSCPALSAVVYQREKRGIPPFRETTERKQMSTRSDAFDILEAHKIGPTTGRLDNLAALLGELGHNKVRIETVPRGGLMRAHKATTRKIGQLRKDKSSLEIWAVWD